MEGAGSNNELNRIDIQDLYPAPMHLELVIGIQLCGVVVSKNFETRHCREAMGSFHCRSDQGIIQMEFHINGSTLGPRFHSHPHLIRMAENRNSLTLGDVIAII
jgi:hypothetical protein